MAIGGQTVRGVIPVTVEWQDENGRHSQVVAVNDRGYGGRIVLQEVGGVMTVRWVEE